MHTDTHKPGTPRRVEDPAHTLASWRETVTGALPSSFRDPSGSLFRQEGILYRRVNRIYQDHYDLAVSSGLFRRLTESGFLIPHEEVCLGPADPEVYRILRPQLVPFVSYPYEWCFGQLKDAALATLAIQKEALRFGLCLKDAGAYNIQFLEGRPILMDTLSFEKYVEGEPWVAYRQFCRHFLAPLALMSLKDVRLGQLMRVFIDGIPVDLASRLLPFRSRFRLSLLVHIHLHASAQRRYASRSAAPKGRVSRTGLLGIVESLESAVRGLDWQSRNTEWADYYEDTNYSADALEAKKRLVRQFLDQARPATVWDFGANTGAFSRLASDRGVFTVAFDFDPAAVERNYRGCGARGEKHLLPLILDLTNPSPGIGWENRERSPLQERGTADTVMALALIHHLAISNNLPFDRIASFLGRCGRSLIIEFVPKTDSQVRRLLATRKDVFPDYTQERFEQVFSGFFDIVSRCPVSGSERWLYLMERKAVQG